VLVADIDESGGQETVDAIRADGGDAFFVRTDVTDESNVKSAVEHALERWGGLSVLFNCAGGSLPADSSVTAMDLDAVWDRTVRFNLLGTVLGCRHAIPAMVRSGGGSVVNMSSGAALRGPTSGHIYAMTKAGVLGLTRALAGSHASEGVRVNAICSGLVLTDRIIRNFGYPGDGGTVPDIRDSATRGKGYPFWIGQPEDVAHIAVFLASEESRMITGASIAADGGRSSY
jgi:short-subunit dehydrogenase